MHSKRQALVFVVGLAAYGLMACGGSSGSSPPPPVLTSISITPASPTVAAGVTLQLTAMGIYSDSTIADLTSLVSWSSSSTSVATVSSTGVMTGVIAGSATITANSGAVTGTATATVTAATLQSIQVTPTNPNLAAGTTAKLTAMGIFSDMSKQDLTSQVTWSSDDMTHATVAPTGIATAVAIGTAKITASLNGVSGSTTLTTTAAVLLSLSIESTPTPPRVALGLTLQLHAIGTFTDSSTPDLTNQVTWTSADPGTASVDATGLVTSLAANSTQITAAMGTISASVSLTVTAAQLTQLTVTPAMPSVAAGLSQQFTATGTFTDNSTLDLTPQVTWMSSDVTVATISNAPDSIGLASAVAPGPTTISATLGPISGSTTLTVTAATLIMIEVDPAAPTISAGTTLQFKATGIFTDRSKLDLTAQVTWTSDDDTVATVSNEPATAGLATGVAKGSATIAAALPSAPGIIGSTTLTVTDAVVTHIAVAPANPAVAAGLTQQFTATATFSDMTTLDVTTQVTWSSSNTDVATIANSAGTNGLATTFTAGTTTITAVLPSAPDVPGSTTLTVTPAVLVEIDVAPLTATLPNGRSLQFTAQGVFSDGSTLPLTAQVTWASSDATVATISNDPASAGLATAVAATGTTTISAVLPSVPGITGLATLTATDAALDSVAIAPATASVIPGGTQQYTATATFSDRSTGDITKTVVWATSDATIATISNSDPTEGVATGVAVGTATITAASGTVTSNSVDLTVTPPSLLSVAPADGTVDVLNSAAVVLTFNEAVDPASITTQVADGACTGSLQLSADSFQTCVGFAAASAALDATRTIATATPAVRLGPVATYQVRAFGTITNAGGFPLGTDFTQPVGFKTAGVCASRVVVSQVYGGGGNTGAQFTNDFIELHNVGPQPIDITGLVVQFVSAAGTGKWATQVMPETRIPGGGYFLIQEIAGANNTTPKSAALPTPDLDTTTLAGFTPFSIGQSSAKVALTTSTTPLTLTGVVCSALLAMTNDLIGFGSGVNCFEGTAGGPASSNTTSEQRNDGGCTDSNDNSADFTALAPVPRNGMTAPAVCSCPGSTATN